MEVVLVAGLLLLGIVVLTCLSRRTSRCRSCGKARVPGKDRCPFCGTAYTQSPVQSSDVPSLRCIEGSHQGRQFPIQGAHFSIGRSSENSLVQPGELVSRRHAIISYQDGSYRLYDRESTNGTWVNGRRIAQHILQPGDQIRIGPAVFVFQMAGAAALVPAGPTPQPIRVATPAPLERRHDFEDYQLVETLGGGGAATVYRAVSRLDGGTAAIKILHQADPYLVDKFEQEGRILKLLQHPHIVRVYDYGQSNGRYYILMEYVENGSLRDRLTPGHPLALDSAVSVAGQTCEALAFAHAKGVIHRDIKPENILFSSSGGIKVVDFGIARWASAPKRTTDGIIIGTPYYMSYEQAKGVTVHPQSDIYSLGVVLYEMLTGRVPFTGDALTVVHRHLTENAVAPRQVNPTIPGSVEQVIMRSMAKDYRQRFASARDLAHALGYAPVPMAVSATPAVVRGKGRRPQPIVSPPSSAVDGAGRLVTRTGKQIALGSDLVLTRGMLDPNDTSISRKHARLFRQGGEFWLVDLDSTNGTYLNGQRIFDPKLLRTGDEIRLGNTRVRFEAES